MKNYKEKSGVLTKIEDVDKKQGIVIFYTSAFNNKDSDGDIITKGAFSKSLNEGFNRFRHLKNHYIPVGLPIKDETYEDDYGLRVGSKLFKGIQDADELLIQYETYAEMGNAMEHSFGYETLREDFDKEKNANILKELKIWEFTTMTTWGANQNALQVGLKNMNPLILIRELKVLRKMIKGDFKDSRLEQYENKINEIELILLNSKPPTSGKKPGHDGNKQKEYLLKLINNGRI